MKVHGEGLADEDLKSDISDDSNEDTDEDLDLDEMDDVEEDETGGLKVSATNRKKPRVGGRRKRVRMSTLNSDGDDANEDEDDDEQEDKTQPEIKREYSPEQTGDGKRPYRRLAERKPKAPRQKLSQLDNQQYNNTGVSVVKRGRKPRGASVADEGQMKGVIGCEQSQTASDLLTSTYSAATNATGNYYPLGGYTAAVAMANNQNGAHNQHYAQSNINGVQSCHGTPTTDRYGHLNGGQHHLGQYSTLASHVQTSSSSPSNSSTTTTTPAAVNSHLRSQQQMSRSPTGGQLTAANGTSPSLSEW